MSQRYGITEYPNTFKRQGSFPLDNSTVFDSLNKAIEYAKSNPIAYEGQVITVTENNDVIAYSLKKSAILETNYELVMISSRDTDLINTKVGTWSVSKISNSSEAHLDFDILYPIVADSYQIFFNDFSISEILPLSDEFITDMENFNDDSMLITFKFYSNNVATFQLNAKIIYKNTTRILGALYLTEIFDSQES